MRPIKPQGIQGLRILIVEADVAYRDGIIETLRNHIDSEAEITTAGSVGEALLRLYQKSFDVVIMDENVKGNMDGMNLWEKAKENFRMPPTIIMSAGVCTIAVNRSPVLQTTELAILQKPFHIIDLKAAMAVVTSERIWN